jgi:hypothetical protein
MRIARACSLRSRYTHINRFCAGGLQLSFCLLDIYFRSDASMEAAFVDIF